VYSRESADPLWHRSDRVIVDDVPSDPRYLVCSVETRSEIVVPIRAKDAVA
jgi:L-methionine (R)-S-oxide reductase